MDLQAMRLDAQVTLHDEGRLSRMDLARHVLVLLEALDAALAENAALRAQVAELKGWSQPGGFGTHRILLTQESWERFCAYLEDDQTPSEGLMRLLAPEPEEE